MTYIENRMNIWIFFLIYVFRENAGENRRQGRTHGHHSSPDRNSARKDGQADRPRRGDGEGRLERGWTKGRTDGRTACERSTARPTDALARRDAWKRSKNVYLKQDRTPDVEIIHETPKRTRKTDCERTDRRTDGPTRQLIELFRH